MPALALTCYSHCLYQIIRGSGLAYTKTGIFINKKLMFPTIHFVMYISSKTATLTDSFRGEGLYMYVSLISFFVLLKQRIIIVLCPIAGTVNHVLPSCVAFMSAYLRCRAGAHFNFAKDYAVIYFTIFRSKGLGRRASSIPPCG